MIKKIVVVLAIVVFLSAAFIADRTLNAQSAGADPEIMKRLDEIADGQKAILQELAAMKEEIRIIKIRVTQNQ